MEPGIQYLLEASIKLGCSRCTKIRAMILYHQFMRCVDDVKYDVAMVAAAALNLSSKVSEEIVNLDTLVLLFYCIVNKTDEVLDSDDSSFVLLRKSLITVDFIMQRMLEYTLNHQLAHQYLVPFLEMIYARSIRIAGYHRAMNETCISLMSDFYTNRQCLNFKPDHIAIACIDAALHIYALEKSTEINEPWYQVLCTDLTSVKLKEIKYIIFRLYKEDELQLRVQTPPPTEKTPDTSSIDLDKDDDVIVEEILPVKKVIEEIVLD